MSLAADDKKVKGNPAASGRFFLFLFFDAKKKENIHTNNKSEYWARRTSVRFYGMGVNDCRLLPRAASEGVA